MRSLGITTDLSDFHPTWAERFNARDVDGMLALEWFLSLDAPIRVDVRHATADIGLVVAEWELAGTGPDGSPVDLEGSTTDVVRRGAGGWKLVIDNPFGTA